MVRARSTADAVAMTSAQHAATGLRVIGPGDGHQLPFLDGSVMSFLVTGEDTDGLVSFWEFTLPGGGQGPPPHVHHGHDELFFVVDGRLAVHGADGTRLVDRGSLVLVPRGAQHTFSNPGTEPMRMVGTFSPARFERYFHELAEEIEKHGGQRPDPSTIARLYDRYDSELVT
jgi:mannose-6-phosphate isomerase-like protein (cupin superfamily)